MNGRPLVSLPEKTVCVEQVELSQSEREEYELARNEGRNTISRCALVCVCMFEVKQVDTRCVKCDAVHFVPRTAALSLLYVINAFVHRYVAEGTILRNYADVLAILMRLRQHCCHPDLSAKTSSDLGITWTRST